jgi:hypothetical protein
LFVWSLDIALLLNCHPSLFLLSSYTPRTSKVL